MQRKVYPYKLIPNQVKSIFNLLELDIVGESFNTDNKPVNAISYGVANTAKYTLPENQNFIKPEMVSNIPDVIPPPKPGPLEAIDEVNIIIKNYSKCK